MYIYIVCAWSDEASTFFSKQKFGAAKERDKFNLTAFHLKSLFRYVRRMAIRLRLLILCGGSGMTTWRFRGTAMPAVVSVLGGAGESRRSQSARSILPANNTTDNRLFASYAAKLICAVRDPVVRP